MAHWFEFNGTDSREMHIMVPDAVQVVRPEERVEHVIIPGRSGELTQTQGTDIYNSYIQTVPIHVMGQAYLQAAESWLRGEGWVTFDCQPALRQKARIIGAVTFAKVSKNLDVWSGDVQFYCEPWKSLSAESDIVVTESGTAINNPGQLTALPLITMNGSGRVTLRMGGNALVIPSLTSGWVADSENNWILNNGRPVMNAWSGAFPALPVGQSLVQWTGNITSLVITPRYRFL